MPLPPAIPDPPPSGKGKAAHSRGSQLLAVELHARVGRARFRRLGRRAFPLRFLGLAPARGDPTAADLPLDACILHASAAAAVDVSGRLRSSTPPWEALPSSSSSSPQPATPRRDHANPRLTAAHRAADATPYGRSRTIAILPLDFFRLQSDNVCETIVIDLADESCAGRRRRRPPCRNAGRAHDPRSCFTMCGAPRVLPGQAAAGPIGTPFSISASGRKEAVVKVSEDRPLRCRFGPER